MQEHDFLPLSRPTDCARAPAARSITAMPDIYLAVVSPGATDSLLGDGLEVRRTYFTFPLLEVTCSPAQAETLARDPRIEMLLPALGSLGSRRTLAEGFAALAAFADGQNRQTIAEAYGGRRVGDEADYPVLVPDGRGFKVEFDPHLDWPVPPALVPVINFSVGPTSASHPFLANDIVNIATYLASRSMLVVAAAGNCGRLGDGTLSAWAQAPWVLAVGATSDEEGTTLAEFSSRGWADVDGSGPDLVAYGRSEVSPHPMGTSFAAPRVTALARLVAAAMAQVGRAIRVAGGADDHGVPLVGSAIIDDFEGELTHPGVEYLPITALPVTGVDQRAIERYVEAGGDLDVRLTPEWLRSFLLEAATPIPGYAPHQIGRGFLDDERVLRALRDVTFADLERWFATPGSPGAVGPAADARPFVEDELRVLDSLVRQTGPSVRYDYKTQRVAVLPTVPTSE